MRANLAQALYSVLQPLVANSDVRAEDWERAAQAHWQASTASAAYVVYVTRLRVLVFLLEVGRQHLSQYW